MCQVARQLPRHCCMACYSCNEKCVGVEREFFGIASRLAVDVIAVEKYFTFCYFDGIETLAYLRHGRETWHFQTQSGGFCKTLQPLPLLPSSTSRLFELVVASSELTFSHYIPFHTLTTVATMAAALYPSRNDTGPSVVPAAAYQRPLMNDLDFRDNRYPSMTPQRQSTAVLASQTRSGPEWKPIAGSSSSQAWDPIPGPANPQSSKFAPSDASQSQSPSQEQPQRSTVSYSLPPDSSRRVVERYSLDGPAQRDQPLEAEDGPVIKDVASRSNTQRSARQPPSQDPSTIPPAPRHSTLPPSAAAGTSSNVNGYQLASTQMPLAASPNYNPPVSSRQRAYAQQPYITQNVAPKPVNPVFLPNNGEEVCVECAMRDQDMADVDVTSPGVWDRDSDVFYEDLRRKEEEEERTGIISTEGPPRPKYKGGLLTEQNLKIWLSLVCPRRSSLSCLLLFPRTPANRPLDNRHSASMSSPKGHCLKQSRRLVHVPCRKQGSWMTECGTPTRSYGDPLMTWEAVLHLPMIQVVFASNHQLLRLLLCLARMNDHIPGKSLS